MFVVFWFWLFIPGDLLKIFIPLSILMREDVKFKSTIECEDNFQELKWHLTSASILSIPSGIEEFHIYSDASLKGLECI